VPLYLPKGIGVCTTSINILELGVAFSIG
jgi:hypothetical protein